MYEFTHDVENNIKGFSFHTFLDVQYILNRYAPIIITASKI